LAKAAIALANHGGGIIVLGMPAQASNGPLESMPRPAEINLTTRIPPSLALDRYSVWVL